MCRSSASAILRSSSFDHVIECLLVNFAFLLAPQIQPRILSPSARTTPSLDGRDSGDTKCRVWIVERQHPRRDDVCKSQDRKRADRDSHRELRDDKQATAIDNV